jgi:molybdopterin synthase catalytic subunit/molybdopterin converting factor small subunit
MRVRVLFFGMLKDLAGRSEDSLELPDSSTLADLLVHYQRSLPRIEAYLPAIALSLNQEYALPSAALHDRDEVGLLPPVSGGADRNPSSSVSIVREKIDTQKIGDEMKRPEDGAMVVFEGIVRDNTRGRRTLYLDYEAYEPMAKRQMEELTKNALAQFDIREVAIIHRLGRLQHRETSVLIVVAAAHRGPAYEASRWLIDNLKRTVPIWKKEYFEDGAVWADGEPFPDDIPTAAPSVTKPSSQ